MVSSQLRGRSGLRPLYVCLRFPYGGMCVWGVASPPSSPLASLSCVCVCSCVSLPVIRSSELVVVGKSVVSVGRRAQRDSACCPPPPPYPIVVSVFVRMSGGVLMESADAHGTIRFTHRTQFRLLSGVASCCVASSRRRCTLSHTTVRLGSSRLGSARVRLAIGSASVVGDPCVSFPGSGDGLGAWPSLGLVKPSEKEESWVLLRKGWCCCSLCSWALARSVGAVGL